MIETIYELSCPVPIALLTDFHNSDPDPILGSLRVRKPEIITIAIGSGAIGCTIVTDSLFWLVKQYCGATLSETFKYYTTATFIASVLALGGTFLLSFII